MKIVVATALADVALHQLRGLGNEVVYEPDATADRLKALAGSATILVVGSQRVARETIEAAKTLQMIVHAGEGPGDVALDDASVQGVFVTHCPNKYADAVAELALGLAVMLDRGILDQATALREGRWERSGIGDARGLAGRSFGVLGYGIDGQRVARLAVHAGMQVYAWSPNFEHTNDPSEEVELCNFPHEVSQHCEIVCVCSLPRSESLPVVERTFLEALPDGASLIHLGPPQAVDEAAVARAVREKGLRVAIDSFQGAPNMERAKFRSALLDLPRVIGTPAIARVTRQARDSIAAEVVRIVRTFLVSGEALHCLNLLERSPATWQLVLRVRDQVGVMASILDAIRADGVNAEEITSRVFTGAKAAWCAISLDERPSKDALESIRKLPDVMHLELRAMV
jgi:D-3-phosphoglycerate dehydrogenase